MQRINFESLMFPCPPFVPMAKSDFSSLLQDFC